MAIVFFLATVLVLTGCDSLFVSPTERTIAQPETEDTPVSSIPFTSRSVLDRLDSSDETIIPWKLARTLTYIEFRSYLAEEHGWTHATLSEYPVVVYDTQSRPQYYEFIVQNPSGEAVGTITAHGRKVSTEIVSHILPFVRDYGLLQTKGDSYAQVASIYPRSVLIGIPGKSGDDITLMLDPVTGKADTPAEFMTEEETIAKLRAMSPEELQQVAKISHGELEQQITQSYADRQQQEAQVTEYWSYFSPVPQEALTVLDEEIDQRFVETKRDRNKRTDSYKKILGPETGNDDPLNNNQLTFWGGWCVPSSISWAYRLFYDRYNGTDLPLHGDSDFTSNVQPDQSVITHDGFGPFRVATARFSYYDFTGRVTKLDEISKQSQPRDGGLYYDIARVGQISSDGTINPLFLIDDMVSTITKGAYTATYHLFGRTGMYNQIYNNHKPVFVGALMTNGHAKKGGHMFALAGTKRQVQSGETQFLFWWIPWKKIGSPSYLVHDNGYITGSSSALGGNSRGTYQPFWVTEDGLFNNIAFPFVYYWE